MKIIKIPWAGSAFSSKGCKDAPNKIINELKDLFLNENNKAGFLEIENVELNDNLIEKKKINEKLAEIKTPAILLGGSHSITIEGYKEFRKTHPDGGMIIFDAHPDSCSPINGESDLLPALVEEGLDTSKLILVGVRNIKKEEKEFLEANRIRIFNMKHVFNMGVKNICDGLMESVKDWPGLYLSIDIDVVDPAYAPGTGVMEPGGLTSREMIYVIQRLRMLKNLAMMDICEIDPSKDLNNMTSKLGAKLIKELI